MSDREVSGAARALRGSASFDQTFLNALGDQKDEVLKRIFRGQSIKAHKVTVRLGRQRDTNRPELGAFWAGNVEMIFLRCPQPQEIIDFIIETNPEMDRNSILLQEVFDNVRAGHVRLQEVLIKA